MGRENRARQITERRGGKNNRRLLDFSELSMVARKIKLLVIVGPTASGKTTLAIQVAKIFNGEVVSADSRAVYKYMNIGTAKPDIEEQDGIIHWGIDLVGPNETFTASDYKKYACQKIREIASKNRLPILVGGSGLYIDSIIYDYSFAPPNKTVRSKMQSQSIGQLNEIIKKRQLELPNNYKNKRYLIRTIEVGNRRVSKNERLLPGTVMVGLWPNKEVLKGRINRRLKDMISKGLLPEIKKCSELYGWDSIAMNGGVYKSFRGYIKGGETLESAINSSIKSDTALAKKQLTWFKRNKNIIWFESVELAMNWLVTEHKGTI